MDHMVLGQWPKIYYRLLPVSLQDGKTHSAFSHNLKKSDQEAADGSGFAAR